MYIVIDVVFVLFVLLMFYCGFRKGFLTKAWWLVDLALIVVCGILVAPTILQALRGTSLYTGLLNKFTSLHESGSLTVSSPATLTDTVFTVGIWIVLAVAVVIVMAIIKAVLRSISKYRVFRFLDKVLGGVYSAAITVALLFALGALVGTFTDFSPIAKAADFCSRTYIFKYVFGENPIQGRLEASFDLGGMIYRAIYGQNEAALALRLYR